MANNNERTEMTIQYSVTIPNTIRVCGTDLKVEQSRYGINSYMGSVLNHYVRIDLFEDGGVAAYIDGIATVSTEIGPDSDVDEVLTEIVGCVEERLI